MAWDRREFLVFLAIGIFFRMIYFFAGVPLFPMLEPCHSKSYQVVSDGSKDIVTLNEPNIQPFIDSHSKWVLILFHASSTSCPNCVTALSDFAIAAKQLKKEKGDSIVFASVNCDNNIKTCQDQKIDGFPALYSFYDGEFVDEFRNHRLSSPFIAFGRTLSRRKLLIAKNFARAVKAQ